MGQAASLDGSPPEQASSPEQSQVVVSAQSQVTQPVHSHARPPAGPTQSLNGQSQSQSHPHLHSQSQPHCQSQSQPQPLSPHGSQQQASPSAATQSLRKTRIQSPQKVGTLHITVNNTEGTLGRPLAGSADSTAKGVPKGPMESLSGSVRGSPKDTLKAAGSTAKGLERRTSPRGASATKGGKSQGFRPPLALQMAFIVTLLGIAMATLMVSERMGNWWLPFPKNLPLPRELSVAILEAYGTPGSVTVKAYGAPGSVTVNKKGALMVSERLATGGQAGQLILRGPMRGVSVDARAGKLGSVKAKGRRGVGGGSVTVRGKGKAGPVTVKGKANPVPVLAKGKARPVSATPKGKGPVTVKAKGKAGRATAKADRPGSARVTVQKVHAAGATVQKVPAGGAKVQEAHAGGVTVQKAHAGAVTVQRGKGGGEKLPPEMLAQIRELERQKRKQREEQELEFVIAGEDRVKPPVRQVPATAAPGGGAQGGHAPGDGGGVPGGNSAGSLSPFETGWEDEELLRDRIWEGVGREDAWLFERAMRTDEGPWRRAREAKQKKQALLKGSSGKGGSSSAGRVPSAHRKVAFLFLTRGPLPLAPLWSTFFKGHEDKYSIFIHTPEKFKFQPGSLPPPFRGRQIPSKDVKWGHMNVIDAERRLLGNALLDPLNERFVLLSESCIPLYNFTFIYSTLINLKESFLHMGSEMGRSGIGRWNEGFKPLVPINVWRKGSQWFQITRPVARTIVGDALFYPKFRDHCVQSCHPDEYYLPTMLNAMRVKHLARRDLTWTDWSQGGCHPRTFRRQEISMRLLQKIRATKAPMCSSHCFLFARKFEPQALGPLLRLMHL